jgi:hypothetical protein
MLDIGCVAVVEELGKVEDMLNLKEADCDIEKWVGMAKDRVE